MRFCVYILLNYWKTAYVQNQTADFSETIIWQPRLSGCRTFLSCWNNTSNLEPCSWLNYSLFAKSGWEGINTLQQLQHGSEPRREFISTNWLPKASLLSKHNRWIHTFHIQVPSHLWAGDQQQSSCERLSNNRYGSQLLSWVSLSSLLMRPSLLTLGIKWAE